MRKFSLIIAVLILISLQTGTAYSQTTEFTFQGSLTTSGSPANGNYDFEFYLYDALSAGSQVGSVVAINNVAVANGVFSVKLNFGNQFSGANRFLEIRLRPTGQAGMTILSPRQPLGSAPYSVKSLMSDNATTSATSTNALNLGGVAANQFVLTTDPRMTDARPPIAGSSSYIQNTTVEQPGTNFRISGSGFAGGLLSAQTVNATNGYNLGGFRVLSAQQSTNSLFVGINAGQSNPTGIRNTFFGTNSGPLTTTGQDDAFFGYSSGGKNIDGVSNAFFGSLAGYENTSGGANSFLGTSAGNSNTSGDFNTFVGFFAGEVNMTGSNNTTVGANSDVSGVNLTYATAIGADAIASASNSITLGRAAGQDIVRIPGNLVVETLSTGGTTAICRNAFLLFATCSSSARYKTNITTFGGGLDLIHKLHPVQFNWKQDGMPDLGLVAEEVNKVAPLLTTTNSNGEVEGVKYDRVGVLMINAVKEQQSEIDQLRRENQNLSKDVRELKEMIKAQQKEINELRRRRN